MQGADMRHFVRMYYEIRVPTPALSGSGPLGMISARIAPDTPANCYVAANINTFVHKTTPIYGQALNYIIFARKSNTVQENEERSIEAGAFRGNHHADSGDMGGRNRGI